MAAANVTHPG